MGIASTIKRMRVPAPSELIAIPNQMKTATKNQKLNQVNIRYFDRFFKKCIILTGTKEYKTSIPIVYFESPNALACIVFDDSEYMDEQNRIWIDICEDYPFALNHNTELVQILNQQYYNDFAENKIAIKKDGEQGYESYKIPVLLNRIPREVTRINPGEKNMVQMDEKYLANKGEVTQYILRQIGRIKFLERVGKEDNHDLITGVLVAAPIFILVGIFISFAFLVN